MLLKLCLLFVAVPLLEMALLVAIGNRIGLGPTLGLILLTGLVGAALARRQGAAALRRIRDTLRAGSLPAAALVDGALIVVAGILLLTPGFLTDATGLALLLPPLRARLAVALRQMLKRHVRLATMAPPGAGTTPNPDGLTVEGKAIRVEDLDD